jgi:hypothetical protein
MKCLYYPAPTLESTRRISDDLQAAGLEEYLLHVISKDEAGLRRQHIHSSNYFETLDLLRDGLIGSGIGFILGLVGAGLMKWCEPFGPNVPPVVYVAILAAATLFGAWEGGLTGIATENRKLAPFHGHIEAGRYLILVYAPERLEMVVRKLMSTRHPEAPLAAIDPHFANPFSPVRPGWSSAVPRGGPWKAS